MWRQHKYRGVRFEIGLRTPFPGVGWRIRTYDHLMREVGLRESAGAFYDGAPDHPEGAVAWAEASAKAFIDSCLTTKL